MHHKTLETVTTAYNTVEINQVGKRIDMDVEGATFATWHPEHYLTGYSWDAVTAGCLLHPEHPPASILMLGLAGGTVARQLRLLLPDVKITAIEIDPVLVELARTYMELEPMNVHVEVADAYHWLKTCPDHYDVVIDDIYLSGRVDVERPLAPTGETLALLRRCTAPSGLVVANMITDDPHQALFHETRSAFSSRFTATCGIPAPKGFNHILVGGRRLGEQPTLTTYTARFPSRRDRDWWQRLRVVP